MKKAFTLIELIFVIVIIGLLAAVAVPRFFLTEVSASKANLKSTVASVQTAIDNLHGEWVSNDDFTWDGHNSEWDNSTGYPKQLDDGKETSDIFSYILRKPVIACNEKFDDSSKYTNCFYESDTNVYRYYFSPKDYVEFNYSNTDGLFHCMDGSKNFPKKACKDILG